MHGCVSEREDCALQARAAAWLPELPPKAAAGASPYINEILDFLTVPSVPTPSSTLTCTLGANAMLPVQLSVCVGRHH